MMMDDKEYQRTLPRKRMSAGALFLDENGRLLIVEPTYKPVWEIPGGVVELNESPRAGCEREVREELGLERPLRRLLCVDYLSPHTDKTEALAFIFWGGVLSPAAIRSIRLPVHELRSFAFLAPETAVARLSSRLGRRVRRCLAAVDTGQTLYLEDQRPMGEIT